jgi:hypothetical protein
LTISVHRTEFLKGLSHAEDLKGDLILCRDGSNSDVGIVLTPHNVILMQVVELWYGEGIVLLFFERHRPGI